MSSVGIGHNGGPALDDDAVPQKIDGDKLRAAVTAIKYAVGQRKIASDRLKDVRNDAKASNIIPRAMTFLVSRGYAADQADEMLQVYDAWCRIFYGRDKQTCITPDASKLKEFVLRFVEENNGRKTASRDVTEAYAEAEAQGFSKPALRLIASLGELDEIERADLFASVDTYATFLRLW